MKKILIMLLPMLMVIAIVFYIREKDFDSHVMLEFISNLRFSNAYDQLVSTRNIWGNMLDTFDSLSKPQNPIDFLSTIVEGIIYFFRATLSLGLTIFEFLNDIVSNVFEIFNYFFVS